MTRQRVLVTGDGMPSRSALLAIATRLASLGVAEIAPDPQFEQVVLSSAWPEPPPGNRHARRKWMATRGKRRGA
jgi:hypothetical protein